MSKIEVVELNSPELEESRRQAILKVTAAIDHLAPSQGVGVLIGVLVARALSLGISAADLVKTIANGYKLLKERTGR